MSGERCLACMKPLVAGMNRCPYCGSAVPCEPNPEDSLPLGYILNNRFVIGKVIGRGGYGITYIAFDSRLQIIRCIKEYFPQKYNRRPDMSPEVPPEKEEEFQRLSDHFLKEARIMSSMSEERISNIVNVFDQLNLNGTTYILMEYLDGCTLDEWITKNGKGLSWQETIRVMQSVLQTLEEIHHHGYLHRDISLSNIFRMQDGSVRVIDFGSAELIGVAQNEPQTMWPSSKRYYSPEEQVGNSSQGPWTDVYAAGVCMFKMLAGGLPANQYNSEPYPSLRAMGITVPEAADRIIFKATQPDPRKRYSTAASMLDALNKAAEEERPLQPSQPTLQPASWQSYNQVEEWKPAEEITNKGPKKGLVILIALIAVAVIAAAVILFGGAGGGTRDQNTPAISLPPTPTPEPPSAPPPVQTEESVEPSALTSTEEPTTPTPTPTEEPSTPPTATPTEEPSTPPTATPTEEPMTPPTATPTEEPTTPPTPTPTDEPTTPRAASASTSSTSPPFSASTPTAASRGSKRVRTSPSSWASSRFSSPSSPSCPSR